MIRRSAQIFRNRRLALDLMVVLFFALCAGCQSLRPVDTMASSIDAELADAKMPPAAPQRSLVPTDISQALLPPLQFGVGKSKPQEREGRFDFSAENVAARQVFMSLVEGTSYSMVVSPDVTGSMSMQLKSVTVPEALAAIRESYGYEFRRDGRRFLIQGTTLQTRVFTVNYLDVSRKGHSQIKVSSSDLQTGAAGSAAGAGSGAAGASGGKSPGIQLDTNSNSDFWKTTEMTLKAIVGSEGGRHVVANAQAGLIVVKATPAELRVVEEFLGLSQVTVNRQVMIEAKIIEVELDDAFQSGINWSVLGTSGQSGIVASQTGGGQILGGSGVSNSAGQLGNLQPDAFAPIKSSITSAFGGIFALQANMRNFSAFFELLKTQGKVHVLSSPRISTVNNQKAVIKVGGDEFFVTAITPTPATVGATVAPMPSVELTPFFSGIALDVTPHVDSKKNVILHIHPSVSSVSQKDKSIVLSGASYSLPLAFSTIQESDSVVRAGSGEIIVIGGLMKEGVSDQNASVPLLADLPLVGDFFKHQKLTRIKKELIILLKPTVMDADKLWENVVQVGERKAVTLDSAE